MLKIRLRRMGSRHRPFYRVVVSDSRQVPTASAVEEIGFYDPRKTPATLQIEVDRVDFWVGRGAQLSESVSKLVRRLRSGLAEAPASTTEKEQPAADVAATAEAEAPAAAAAEVETPAEEAAEAKVAEAEAPAAAADSTEDDETPTAEASQA